VRYSTPPTLCLSINLMVIITAVSSTIQTASYFSAHPPFQDTTALPAYAAVNDAGETGCEYYNLYFWLRSMILISPSLLIAPISRLYGYVFFSLFSLVFANISGMVA
jgi:hypothetical protein